MVRLSNKIMYPGILADIQNLSAKLCEDRMSQIFPFWITVFDHKVGQFSLFSMTPVISAIGNMSHWSRPLDLSSHRKYISTCQINCKSVKFPTFLIFPTFLNSWFIFCPQMYQSDLFDQLQNQITFVSNWSAKGSIHQLFPILKILGIKDL